MESVTATFRNGRLELAEPVDWPHGTQVNVTPLGLGGQRVRWLSLPPLDVGQFGKRSAGDDLPRLIAPTEGNCNLPETEA